MKHNPFCFRRPDTATRNMARAILASLEQASGRSPAPPTTQNPDGCAVLHRSSRTCGQGSRCEPGWAGGTRQSCTKQAFGQKRMSTASGKPTRNHASR